MNDLKNVNSDYPTVSLEFPQIIFHDASAAEKNAINKIRKNLMEQLFYLSASEDLNTLREYIAKYPNTTFTVGVEEEYNDEGYDTRVTVRASTDDAQEEAAFENSEDSYYMADKLTIDVIARIESAKVNTKTFDSVGTRLLGKNLYETWKLGKIGLEKKHLDEVVATPEEKTPQSYKL